MSQRRLLCASEPAIGAADRAAFAVYGRGDCKFSVITFPTTNLVASSATCYAQSVRHDRSEKRDRKGNDAVKPHIRAEIKQLLQALKRQLGPVKVLHRDLSENTVQLHSLFPPLNLWAGRRKRMTAQV